jgi:hypothetical protein
MFTHLLAVQLCMYLIILNGQLCIIRLLQLLCNNIGHLGVLVVFRVGIRLDDGV